MIQEIKDMGIIVNKALESRKPIAHTRLDNIYYIHHNGKNILMITVNDKGLLDITEMFNYPSSYSQYIYNVNISTMVDIIDNVIKNNNL